MPRLAHHVFFTLHDSSDAAVTRFLEACQKYLSGHDGVIDFSMGRRDVELNRPVNNTEYHVSVHLIFRDRAAHDAYQTAPRHLEFIAEQQSFWKAAEIFDSLLLDA